MKSVNDLTISNITYIAPMNYLNSMLSEAEIAKLIRKEKEFNHEPAAYALNKLYGKMLQDGLLRQILTVTPTVDPKSKQTVCGNCHKSVGIEQSPGTLNYCCWCGTDFCSPRDLGSRG
jgi:hypothetical protein